MNPVMLLVEDDENDVFLVHEAFALAAPDVRVLTAREGTEALAMLRHKPPYDSLIEFPLPSLILTDLQMPQMNGFELLAAIRRSHTLRHLITCIYSASPRPEDVARAYQLGANLYLNKPTQFQDLIGFARALVGILPLMRVHPDIER